MPVLVVMVALAVASIVYVYRFRGEARYESLTEYFRKGWPIFSPLNCALYMTTLPRGSKAVLDPADFPELDLLRQNWQAIRDEGMELLRQNYFDATKRPGTAGYYDVGFRSFFKYGWSHFYVRWYGYTHHSARRLCPRTVAILRRVPARPPPRPRRRASRPQRHRPPSSLPAPRTPTRSPYPCATTSVSPHRTPTPALSTWMATN